MSELHLRLLLGGGFLAVWGLLCGYLLLRDGTDLDLVRPWELYMSQIRLLRNLSIHIFSIIDGQ